MNEYFIRHQHCRRRDNQRQLHNLAHVHIQHGQKKRHYCITEHFKEAGCASTGKQIICDQVIQNDDERYQNLIQADRYFANRQEKQHGAYYNNKSDSVRRESRHNRRKNASDKLAVQVKRDRQISKLFSDIGCFQSHRSNLGMSIQYRNCSRDDQSNAYQRSKRQFLFYRVYGQFCGIIQLF